MTSYVCNEGKPLARFLRVREKADSQPELLSWSLLLLLQYMALTFQKVFLARGKTFSLLNLKARQHTIPTE